MMKTLTIFGAAALAALLIAGPARAQEDGHEGHDRGESESAHEDLVVLDDTTLAEFGVETATAGAAQMRDYRTLPGEVRADQDRVAHIVPRFAGVVKEVRARIGDTVEAGQTLAVVESDESLTNFRVRTLLGGTVIDRHLSLGEAVSRDEAIFVIADLDTVWIDIAVYLRDLEAVREGLPVSVSCGRHDEARHTSIAYVSPVVDEATRTATARVIMPNDDRHWRPGMFITAAIETRSREVAVAVPETALMTVEGKTSVFVRTAEGFVPRPVTTGGTAGGLVEITTGLHAGEIYVASGGFTLKAELEKDSFGDGHNH